jgi:hypothetical protein
MSVGTEMLAPVGERIGGGRRALGLGCAALLVLVFSLAFGYVWWANRLPPPEPETAVIPLPNGFDAITAAVGKLVSGPRGSPLDKPSQASPAALKAALAPNEPALAAVRKALRMAYLTPPIRDPQTLLPYLASARDAARDFVAESVVAQSEGQVGAAMDRALDAVELGSRVRRGGLLIHHLSGIAATTLGYRQALRCVATLPPDAARASGRRLDRILKELPTAADAVREDRKFSLATLRMMFSGAYPVNPFSPAGTARPNDPLRPLVMAVYPKSWSYQHMDGYYKATIEEAEKPYGKRQPVWVGSDPMVQALAPTMGVLNFRTTLELAHLRLLRLELALREYRSAHGRYPRALAELPAVSTATRQDPFAAQPLIYRPSGSAYRLYSVGPDGTDDGGQPLVGLRSEPDAKGDLPASGDVGR